MPHPFLEGARAKFNRAEKQFAEIKRKSVSGFAANQNPVQRHDDARTHRSAWIWADQNPQHWIDLSLDTGEMLHNLRSSLDHVAWAFARVNKPTPFRRTAFPFVEKKANWRVALKNELRDISPVGQSFIERFQPYQTRNRSFNRRLQIVHKLNNTDKHALLNTAVTPMTDANYRTFIPGTNQVVSQGMISLSGAKPGVELFSTDGLPPGEDVEVNFTFIDLIEDPREGIVLKTRGDIPRLIRTVKFVVAKADILIPSL